MPAAWSHHLTPDSKHEKLKRRNARIQNIDKHVRPCFKSYEGKYVVDHKWESVAVESFTIVTLNQWFDIEDKKERTTYLVKELQNVDPDIICFQESMCILKMHC